MKYRMIVARNIKGFKIDETSSSMVWMKSLAQNLPEFVFRKMKDIPGIETLFLVPFSSANTITDEVDSWSDLLRLFTLELWPLFALPSVRSPLYMDPFHDQSV